MCKRADIDHRHGLRHYSAQMHYKELTGWDCPAKGAPTKEDMNAQQRVIDRAACLQLSLDLCHSHISIVQVYVK
ncbi:hypothetical protein [Candidatus Coxiella mudrowiae]|uniref:hypothetical protein n=1 Tax=Candidatus Coxiella mudrowiae TaxID=2054173 RepID=UPI0006624F88|nr:hypothetical protein [Candidatus Coxiella mudrowiae]